MAWIHRDDLVRLILHVICDADLFGPVNAVAPEPVRNTDFTRTLSQAVRRPARLRLPAKPMRLLLGEMSDLLLSGQRALPARARITGFRFRFPTLSEALHDLV
jgi:NAD dependent epimerase/dehydratase family enzyme